MKKLYKPHHDEEVVVILKVRVRTTTKQGAHTFDSLIDYVQRKLALALGQEVVVTVSGWRPASDEIKRKAKS